MGAIHGRGYYDRIGLGEARRVDEERSDGSAQAGSACAGSARCFSPENLRWENPNTGAHGTVTPLPSTYQQSGVTCRDVLMSYVRRATCRGFRARLATVGAASGKC